MLIGKASQNTPSSAMPQRSRGGSGRRAAERTTARLKPIRMRPKVMPSGGSRPSASAMNRNEAPQMRPGVTSRSQAPASEGSPGRTPPAAGAGAGEGGVGFDMGATLPAAIVKDKRFVLEGIN